MAEDVEIREGGSWELLTCSVLKILKSNTGKDIIS